MFHSLPIIIIAAVVWFAIGSFSIVLLFGAPFLPTLRPQIEIALDMLETGPETVILELGCGDGRVLVAAAKRGAKAVGYELNPILALIAWIRTRRFRNLVTVRCADYWRADWPKANGIFAFLLPRYMSKLHKKIIQYNSRPLWVASFAFAIKPKKPSREDKGVYLYEYK